VRGRSRLVVSIRIGGGRRFEGFVRIHRRMPGLLQFPIEGRDILLPDFRPARDEFLESFFEVFEYGSGLRRGCGIGAVRNSQDAAEMLGSNWKNSPVAFAPGGKP